MKSGAISAKVIGILSNVTLGIILSTSALVHAESAVSEAPSMTLALNAANSKVWNEPMTNTIDTNDFASKVNSEALDKAMEQVSMKLEKQLEDQIARKMDYAMH
jgi:hypothetical protein